MKNTIIKMVVLAMETITAAAMQSNLCRQTTQEPDQLWYLTLSVPN
jgi:hypothetical protein